jgi:hypothetical protein
MGFKLRLRFHGSIALVPSQDKTRVTMLLGKFPQPDVPDEKKLVPHVKFLQGSLQPTKRDVHEPPANSMGSDDMRHVLLDDGELLTLKARVTGQQPLTLNENDDPSPTPVRSTHFSLKWLPHVARIEDPPTGQIHPDLMVFPQDASSSDRGIVGRIDLDKGLLQTTGILDPVLIDFVAPGRDTVTTAIAREAELLLDVDDDRVVLEADSLFQERQPNRDTARDMTFLANGAQELVITIGNEPADEIHQPIPTIRSDAQNDREVREEFRMLYRMSANRNPPNPRLPQVGGRRPSGNLCVIPVYEPPTGL